MEYPVCYPQPEDSDAGNNWQIEEILQHILSEISPLEIEKCSSIVEILFTANSLFEQVFLNPSGYIEIGVLPAEISSEVVSSVSLSNYLLLKLMNVFQLPFLSSRRESPAEILASATP